MLCAALLFLACRKEMSEIDENSERLRRPGDIDRGVNTAFILAELFCWMWDSVCGNIIYISFTAYEVPCVF